MSLMDKSKSDVMQSYARDLDNARLVRTTGVAKAIYNNNLTPLTH